MEILNILYCPISLKKCMSYIYYMKSVIYYLFVMLYILNYYIIIINYYIIIYFRDLTKRNRKHHSSVCIDLQKEPKGRYLNILSHDIIRSLTI